MKLGWPTFNTSRSFSDWLPQRFLVSFMLFICLGISYMMRFSIGLLMIDMVGPEKNNFHVKSCGNVMNGVNSSFNADRTYEFHWSESIQGWIMSSFFYGYVLGTLASNALLSDVRKGKRLLSFGMGGSTLATLLTPYATRSNDVSGIICMRISLGLAQGFVYPAVHAVAGPWVPENERGRLGSIIFSGTCFGNVLTHVLVGFYLEANPGRWPVIFYSIGVLGFIWTVLFVISVPKTPDYHERLTDKEKSVFERYENRAKFKKSETSAPWNKIVKSKPIWALTVACFGHDWGFFTVILDLPKYMAEVLLYPIIYNGLLLGTLYLLIILFACIGGFAVDYFVGRSSILKSTSARKLYNTLASIVPALGLFLFAFHGCNRNGAIVSLFICFSFIGFFYPGIKINALELSPNHAGSVSSFVISLASTSGIIAPHINGFLTPEDTLDEWRTVFYLAAVILAASNILYLLLGSASIQDWDAVSAKSSKISLEGSEITKQEPSNIFISLFVSPNGSEVNTSKARQLWSKTVAATQNRLDEAASVFMPRRVPSTGDVTIPTAPSSQPDGVELDARPGPSGYEGPGKSSVEPTLNDTDLVKFMKQIIDDRFDETTSNAKSETINENAQPSNTAFDFEDSIVNNSVPNDKAVILSASDNINKN